MKPPTGRDSVAVILAVTIGFVLVGAVVGTVIVRPESDDLTLVLINDVFELTKMIVSGLFGLVAGISIANANDMVQTDKRRRQEPPEPTEPSEGP